MELKQLIRECVEETIYRNTVKQIIKEELTRILKEELMEKGKSNASDKDKKDDKEHDEHSGVSDLKAFLDNNPMIKKSQIAYKVLPDVAPDSARHIFNDILDQEDPTPKGFVNRSMDAIRNAVNKK